MRTSPSSPPSSRTRSRTAFTLLELLSVLAIIGVLAGLVIGVGRLAGERGRIARAKAELAALSAALDDYKRRHGDYPQVSADHTPGGESAGRVLYAALNGQRGPALSAPVFAERQKPFIEHARFTFAVTGAIETAPNHFVDPWSRAYRYYYQPGGAWRAAGFVLFSGGPDGVVALPFPAHGLVTPEFEAAIVDGRPANADNLYAHRN